MINKITRKEHPEFFKKLEEDWPIVESLKDHRRGSNFYTQWVLTVDDEYFSEYPQFHGHWMTNVFIWDSDYGADDSEIDELDRVEKKTKVVETTEWVAVK